MSFSEVQAFVAELDPLLAAKKEDSDSFDAAVVVASCLMVGVRVGDLCSYTGYDKPFVEDLVENLKRNDQVEGDRLAVDWLGDEGMNEMGFWTTVLCAMGMIEVCRVPDETA